MRASRILLAVAFAAAAALRPSPAVADDDASAISAATFKEALAAYDAGRYADASKLFERVYLETREPALLFNIAQASRLLGDCPRAVAYYSRFVADAPASADRPRAEAWLAELASCEAPGAAPPLAAAPPLRLAVASPPGVALNATASPPPGSAPRRSRAPALLALGGAAALSGVGALLVVQMHDDSSKVSGIFQNGGPWDDSAIATDRQGRRDETWSRVCFSAAAVLAAGGVALLVWSSGSPHKEGR
jgi:hypothetical protein